MILVSEINTDNITPANHCLTMTGQDDSVVFQFDDSSLEMSLLDISSDSTSPGPATPSSVRPRERERDWASFLRRAEEEDVKNTIIADNIHGHIVVPAICQAVIDTPQFDRLRGLRQLGSAHYVYPAAKHTRWEHSLGVMHLAGQFINHLMLKKPGCADEVDKICVMLAGLCHDLGHGAFSHLWESFVNEAREDHKWSHEKTSLDMLDFIINDNNLVPVFAQNGLTENDITFVKEMIFGPFHQGSDKDGAWPFLGRGPDKFFLYEIVANKISSIDVDKWDYMLRDNSALSIGITFDYRRFILHSDIVEVDGRNRLCIRDKEAESVQEMFLDRVRLHRKGYQHRTIKVIDRMVLDALLAADQCLDLLHSDSGQLLPLSSAYEDILQFSKLSDDFLMRSIQFSPDPRLENAKLILNKIAKRQLYKFVGCVEYCGEMGIKLKEVEKELVKVIKEKKESEETDLQGDDLAIIRKRINMGMGNTNPVENVLFFDKKGRTRGFSSEQLRQVMPREVNSEALAIVCRRDGLALLEDAREVFKTWAKSSFRDKKGLSFRIAD